MLKYDEMEIIIREMLYGKPVSISGIDADEFVKAFQADIDLAKKNGWDIELPFDIQDISPEKEASKSIIVKKGGPGSGFAGHAGREGKVGGSVAGKGIGYKAGDPEYLAKRRARRAARSATQGGKPKEPEAPKKLSLDNAKQKVEDLLKRRPEYSMDSVEYSAWIIELEDVMESAKPEVEMISRWEDPAYQEWHRVANAIRDKERARQASDVNKKDREIRVAALKKSREDAPQNYDEAVTTLKKNGFSAEEARTIAAGLSDVENGYQLAGNIKREKGHSFILNGRKFAAGGTYYSGEDTIFLYDATFRRSEKAISEKATMKMLVHELHHMKFGSMEDELRLLKPKNQKRARKFIKTLRTSFDNENALHSIIETGKQISAYAADWWNNYTRNPRWNTFLSAMNESLAEAGKNRYSGLGVKNNKGGNDIFNDLLDEMDAIIIDDWK